MNSVRFYQHITLAHTHMVCILMCFLGDSTLNSTSYWTSKWIVHREQKSNEWWSFNSFSYYLSLCQLISVGKINQCSVYATSVDVVTNGLCARFPSLCLSSTTRFENYRSLNTFDTNRNRFWLPMWWNQITLGNRMNISTWMPIRTPISRPEGE